MSYSFQSFNISIREELLIEKCLRFLKDANNSYRAKTAKKYLSEVHKKNIGFRVWGSMVLLRQSVKTNTHRSGTLGGLITPLF